MPIVEKWTEYQRAHDALASRDADVGASGSDALLVIDFINPFDYDLAASLLRNAQPAARRASSLIDRARRAGAPVVYVNDNFGRWRSSFEETRESCRKGPGGDIVDRLAPDDGDYFVLKPHRSGFYATPLELLLRDLDARRVAVCGISTDMCVLSTAHDAILRGFEVVIAEDACASFDDARHRRALDLLAESCGVASCPGKHVRFGETAAPARERG